MVLLIGLVSLGWESQPALSQAPVESGEKVYQRILKSTAWVLSPRGRGAASGTGSLIDRTRRLLVTNYHVVGDEDDVLVLFPVFQKGRLVPERDFYRDLVRAGKGIGGRVVARDTRKDLALIQVEALPEGVLGIPIARDSAGPGQRVHSVGNPGNSGALWVYTSGTVRTQPYNRKWRARDERTLYDFEAQVLETQSPTNPGDSGGPLVNDRGELVAVTQGSSSEGNLLSLFVDVSEVKALLRSKGVTVKMVPPAPAAVTRTEAKPAEKPAPAADKAEQLAATRLQFAKTLLDDGKHDRARERCQEIIKAYPMTEAAKEARFLLEKLKK